MNPFKNRAHVLSGSATDALPVIPEDANDLSHVAIGLYVETGGTVSVVTAVGETLPIAVADFSILPLGMRRVQRASGLSPNDGRTGQHCTVYAAGRHDQANPPVRPSGLAEWRRDLCAGLSRCAGTHCQHPSGCCRNPRDTAGALAGGRGGRRAQCRSWPRHGAGRGIEPLRASATRACATTVKALSRLSPS